MVVKNWNVTQWSNSGCFLFCCLRKECIFKLQSTALKQFWLVEALGVLRMATNYLKHWKTVPKSQKNILVIFKFCKILKCLSVMSNGYFFALGMQ